MSSIEKRRTLAGLPSPVENADVTSEGGDPACWLEFVCPECGVVEGDGPHRSWCSGAAGFDGPDGDAA